MLQRWKRSRRTREERLAKQFEFCPVLANLLKTSRIVGKSGKVFNSLGALSSINTLVTLRNLFLDLKPKRSLEVGLCFGASTLLFTGSHREAGKPANRQHVALDPFQEAVWDCGGLMAVESAGLSGYLDYRAAFSSLELPKLLERRERFEMIYVDGSHLFEDVFVDAYFAIRLLLEGGVIAFDDSTNQNVTKALRFQRRSLQGRLEELDLSRYRPDGQSGLIYQVARRLGRVQLTAFRRIGDVAREWNARFHPF
jgi:predicted O-methyltransferase YrrM